MKPDEQSMSPPCRPTDSSRFRSDWIVAGVAVACFINTLPNDFCFDDQPIVQFNERVTAPHQWLNIWTTDYWSHSSSQAPHRDLLYRPVTVTTLRVLYILGGGRAWLFHLAGLLLHALAALLVTRFARRLDLPAKTPLFAGLLFAVLPIHTEVVNSAVGLADLLVTCCTLIALLCHDVGNVKRTAHRALLLRLAVMIAVFAAAASKENGLAALPLIVLFDATRHCMRTREESKGRWISRRNIARLCYLVIPLIVYAALRYHALSGQLFQAPPATRTINQLVDASSWHRALGAMQLWGMYWALTVFPKTLCIEYAINAVRLATDINDAHVLFGGMVALILAWIGIVAWHRRDGILLFLITSLLVCYAPGSNVLVLMRVFFAERIWYLPSVFAVLIIAWACSNSLHRKSWQVMAVTVLIAMTVRCWIRNAEWRSNGTLYAAAYRDHPESAQALHLFGQWNVRHGDFDKGVELLRRSLTIDVGFTDAHRTLGEAFASRGHWDEAISHLRVADMQVPNHGPTRSALATATRAKLDAGADDQLLRLRRIALGNPESLDAHLAVARALRELGMTEEALTQLKESEQKFDARIEWHTELAVTLVYLNRIDDAIQHYRKAVELSPQSLQPMVELAMLLIERRAAGDRTEARALAERANAISSNDPGVLVCRAELEAADGNSPEAVRLYELAIEALPPSDPRRAIFQERIITLGR